MKQVEKSRIEWVDYAKGICIILVVLMHSTLGVEKATGELSWLHHFIEWARPFRMPDFFLISGLFLSTRISASWRPYADDKVIHFFYFYMMWMTIQWLTKAYGIYAQHGAEAVLSTYALGFIEPFGTLWFIYVLAIFFLFTKLVRHVPPLIVFTGAVILEIAHISTGWILIDEFAARFVYFYAGYWLAKYVFAFAREMNSKSMMFLLAILTLWGIGNYKMVETGYAAWPFLSLLLGFIGAAAVITTGIVLAKSEKAKALRYCGQNSIVIYLSFFLFMAASRSVLLKFLPSADKGAVALLVTVCGICGPILLFWATRHTALSFLFRRPAWARLAMVEQRWHSAQHVQQLPLETR